MIYVVDAMCGAGKSTAVLNKMREIGGKKWLYITPLLSEVEERIPEALPDMNFYTPQCGRKGKLEDVRNAFKEGRNVAATHALFRLFDEEIVDVLLDQNYIMVVDESVDAITEYKDGLNSRDIHALLTGDFVIKDDVKRGRLEWNEEKYPEHDGKYIDVRKMCRNKMLYSYNDKFLMCEFPPRLMANISECFVLTYMFRGCSMRYWLEVHAIEYRYVRHEALGLRPEKELKQLVRDNLVIISNRTLDTMQKGQKPSALSSTWFKNTKPKRIDRYRKVLRSCVVANKVRNKDVFWTTYKRQEKRMADNGYGRCFLPLNIKATNQYKDKTFCMYACNPFPNVTDGHYIESLGVNISDEDRDLFSLSHLIQFMFRGSIRQHKQMRILLLSRRMKSLLIKWLEE